MSLSKSPAKNKINLEPKVVAGFGAEWSRFDQESLDSREQDRIFNDYFGIFPWDILPVNAIGADLGCGSGRWAQMVAPKVGRLYLVDASEEALAVAKRKLIDQNNLEFFEASVGALPFNDASLDFAYSLGVLHHVPNTRQALLEVVRTLKPGAPFLIYLYYALDNRPPLFRFIWKVSDISRRVISRLPDSLRHFVCDVIALLVYLPVARSASLMERLGILPDAWPLAYYRDKSLYTMRTDALDRLGTRLELRFTRSEIKSMLKHVGLKSLKFSEKAPYWCVVGVRASK